MPCDRRTTLRDSSKRFGMTCVLLCQRGVLSRHYRQFACPAFPQVDRPSRSGTMPHVTTAWRFLAALRLLPRPLSVISALAAIIRTSINHSRGFDRPLAKCYKSTTSKGLASSIQGPCPGSFRDVMSSETQLDVRGFKFRSHRQNGALL